MKCSIVKVCFSRCFISLYMMWHMGNSVVKHLILTGLTPTAVVLLLLVASKRRRRRDPARQHHHHAHQISPPPPKTCLLVVATQPPHPRSKCLRLPSTSPSRAPTVASHRRAAPPQPQRLAMPVRYRDPSWPRPALRKVNQRKIEKSELT
jgi:multisubunit Na+/H+ antiporter MnhC subunit